MALQAAQDSFNIVRISTPILGIAVGGLVGLTPPARGAGLIATLAGGAVAGAVIGGIWEYTWNSEDSPQRKYEVIQGTALVGGASAVIVPMFLRG